jgi:serine/threonine protein kinase
LVTDAAPTKTWPRDALPRGTMLHGYRIVEILGRGGFGITYKAIDGIDQTFALKEYFPRQFAVRQDEQVLPSDDAAREMFTECLDRFTREARALTLFSGQHGGAEGVVRVMTYFEANGTAYIVMEYLEGETFDRVIAAHPEGLSESELKQILRILLPALERVHANGLLHRDIKPANIFLRDGGHPVLLDFGAARTTSTGQTEAYTSIFTETYAPIEQIEGRKQGPYSDIYALGVTCYKAMAGRTAESTGTMSLTRQAALLRLQPDPLRPATELGAGRYSQRFLQGIDAALRVAPEERPQDVSAFSQAIGLKEPASVDEAPTRLFSARTADAADPALPHEAPTMAGVPTALGVAGVAGPRGLPPPPPPQGGAAGWLVAGGALLVLAVGGGGAYAYWPQLRDSIKPAAPTPVATTITPPPAAVTPPEHTPSPPVQKTQPPGMLIPPPPAGDAPPPPSSPPAPSSPPPSSDAAARADAAYRAADFATALPAYQALAARGDRHAQTRLGLMFLNGEGGPADYAAAREWFQKAADQHYARAEYELGIMAQKGLGGSRDFATMLTWYHRAERDGSPDAAQQLGYAYQEGLGTPIDLAQAAEWYHRAADRGSAAGMFSLGQMYYGGLGVPENKQQARDWIARAATAGSQEAKRWQHAH